MTTHTLPLYLLVGLFALGCQPSDSSPKDDTNDTNDTDPSDPAFAPQYTLTDTIQLDHGGIWSIPVWDGEQLVAGAENGGSIHLATFDLSLSPTGAALTIAGPTDTQTGDGIADHKHIVQNGFHYVTFSVSGDGMGGELLLLKLDDQLERVALVTVVNDAPPTNDMFLVGDGDKVHVGKFLPGKGHEVYHFDGDLNAMGSTVIGDGPDWQHANGASAWFHDDQFTVVAPQTLAPGEGDVFYRLVYDSEWRGVESRKVLISDPTMLGIVSGLTLDPNSGSWLVHYARSPHDYGGDLYLSSFDAEWNLLHTGLAVSGTAQRPHSLVVGDTLYLGYDGGGAYLASFQYEGPIPDSR